jgi:hypothetical protein
MSVAFFPRATSRSEGFNPESDDLLSHPLAV